MEEEIYFGSVEEWGDWLSKNHDKINKISVVCYKKHTGKPTPSHQELMHEAICHGWIDTTVHRVDDEKYIRKFSRRSKNSNWSYNTLGYAKKLIKEKRMKPHGLKFYREGLKKKPLDHGIPLNPEIPEDLKKIFDKNKKLKEIFEKLPPSAKRNYLRWLFRAKMPETRKKRIGIILKNVKEGKRGWS